MNSQQQSYAIALATFQALEAEAHRLEAEYITAHNIANEDGTIPDRLWMIDSDETAETAFDDMAEALEALHLYEVRQALRAVEDDLIMFGLSVMPKAFSNERATLERVCIGPGAIMSKRQKVIDMAFKLDTKTVPCLG